SSRPPVSEAAQATGTDEGARTLAPRFAPGWCKPRQPESAAGKVACGSESAGKVGAVAACGDPVKGKDTLTGAVNGLPEVGVTGLEPATACCRTRWRTRGRPG